MVKRMRTEKEIVERLNFLNSLLVEDKSGHILGALQKGKIQLKTNTLKWVLGEDDIGEAHTSKFGDIKMPRLSIDTSRTSVIDFFEQHPNQWFNPREIANITNKGLFQVSRSLTNIFLDGKQEKFIRKRILSNGGKQFSYMYKTGTLEEGMKDVIEELSKEFIDSTNNRHFAVKINGEDRYLCNQAVIPSSEIKLAYSWEDVTCKNCLKMRIKNYDLQNTDNTVENTIHVGDLVKINNETNLESKRGKICFVNEVLGKKFVKGRTQYQISLYGIDGEYVGDWFEDEIIFLDKQISELDLKILIENNRDKLGLVKDFEKVLDSIKSNERRLI